MPITNVREVHDDIDAYIDEMIERKRTAIIRNFAYVGERCNNAARIAGSYTNHTGNLRSSIGYVIVEDGVIINCAGFEVENLGKEGAAAGRKLAEDLARRYRKGLVLIVVAGMNYASYVSKKGYDVLDSAELLADKLVPSMLNKLGFK